MRRPSMIIRIWMETSHCVGSVLHDSRCWTKNHQKDIQGVRLHDSRCLLGSLQHSEWAPFGTTSGEFGGPISERGFPEIGPFVWLGLPFAVKKKHESLKMQTSKKTPNLPTPNACCLRRMFWRMFLTWEKLCIAQFHRFFFICLILFSGETKMSSRAHLRVRRAHIWWAGVLSVSVVSSVVVECHGVSNACEWRVLRSVLEWQQKAAMNRDWSKWRKKQMSLCWKMMSATILLVDRTLPQIKTTQIIHDFKCNNHINFSTLAAHRRIVFSYPQNVGHQWKSISDYFVQDWYGNENFARVVASWRHLTRFGAGPMARWYIFIRRVRRQDFEFLRKARQRLKSLHRRSARAELRTQQSLLFSEQKDSRCSSVYAPSCNDSDACDFIHGALIDRLDQHAYLLQTGSSTTTQSWAKGSWSQSNQSQKCDSTGVQSLRSSTCWTLAGK